MRKATRGSCRKAPNDKRKLQCDRDDSHRLDCAGNRRLPLTSVSATSAFPSRRPRVLSAENKMERWGRAGGKPP